MDNNIEKLIKEINQKSKISDIISDYISLEKRGNNHFGLCPFHPDTNPSMSVSDSKGIFKCFTCNAGGSGIQFVQNYEGINFIEALKKISTKYNINWKDYIKDNTIKLDPKVVRGYEINKEALTFFSYKLKNNSNKDLEEFLKKRDINDSIIENFFIGFSSDENNELSNFLLKKGFSDNEIVLYGLAKRKDDSTLRDYFINRVIFPIFDINGNILGFSGRVINEKSKYAKYLNSPETPVFEKSKILYNLKNAKSPGSLNKEIIVVEGFMDVIALSRLNINNVVATMGVNLTSVNINSLLKITNNFTLAFDSDIAGINAIIKSGKELLTKTSNVSVVEIPLGKDFDELYKINKDEISKILKQKKKFLDFYKEKIYLQLSKKDSLDTKLIKQLLNVIVLYNDEILKDSILNEISNKFGITRVVLDKELPKENNSSYSDYSNNYSTNQKNYSTNNTQNISFNKNIENEIINDLNNKSKILLSYSISDEKYFKELLKNPILFIDIKWHKLFNNYKHSIENNIELSNEDKELMKKLQDEIINNSEEQFKIKNIKDFLEVIKDYQEMFKKYKINDLKKDIKDTQGIKDKSELSKFVKINTNSK